MTKLFVIKNTKNQKIGGFNLKPGHLFGSINFCDYEIPFIITDPKSGFVYIEILPDDEEETFYWRKIPTTCNDINVIAEGTPNLDWACHAMWEHQYYYECIVGNKPDKIFVEEG